MPPGGGGESFTGVEDQVDRGLLPTTTRNSAGGGDGG